jgi:hypothetical protein
MAARWRALPTQTEVKARTHHADPDQVSVADADGKGAGKTVAPIRVESSVRCTLRGASRPNRARRSNSWRS